MFEVGGTPEFLAMLEESGFQFCEVEVCDGRCGSWHLDRPDQVDSQR